MKPADRKKQLIAEGRIYRAEVILAKENLRAGLEPEALARNALARVAVLALSAFRNRGNAEPGAMNATALLPAALSGVSALVKRKALWKGALVAGAVAGAVTLIAKMKRGAQDGQQDQDNTG